jgi:hypothetical protein
MLQHFLQALFGVVKHDESTRESNVFKRTEQNDMSASNTVYIMN